jgi:hypothetical protein
MWENIVNPGRPQITIWRMRIACWVTKATDTHSEYVIPLFHYNGCTNAPQCYDIRTSNWLSCHNRDGVSLLRGMNWIFQLNGLRFGKDRRIFVSCLPECWLEDSMYPEGPPTGRLCSFSMGFACLQANSDIFPILRFATARC